MANKDIRLALSAYTKKQIIGTYSGEVLLEFILAVDNLNKEFGLDLTSNPQVEVYVSNLAELVLKELTT